MSVRPTTRNFPPVAPFNPQLPMRALNVGTIGVLASRFTQLSLKGGLIFGACGELSQLVAAFAIRYLTTNQTTRKITSEAARVLGGCYLGNLALTAAGCAPLAFGPAAVLIQLLSPYVTVGTLFIISKLWNAAFGNQASHRVVP